MQKSSSDSVKVRYLDREKVLEELRECAAALKRNNHNVHRVLLFGSLLEGNYGPRSDADLLIVMSYDNRRAIDRIPEFLNAFSRVSVGVDVIPLTKAELHKEIESDNSLFLRIVEKGLEIG